MGTELQTVEATALATGSWEQLLTPSALTVLDRARIGERFSDDEIRAVVPIAQAKPPAIIPADDRFLRQSFACLASSLPSKSTDELTGKLRLATYMTMLRGYPEGAIMAGCRRCLEDLDWFPTVRQLKERLENYTSPEQRMIDRAKFIVRNPLVLPEPPKVWTQAEVDQSNATFRKLGIATRWRLGEDGEIEADFDAAMTTQEDAA